MNDPAGDQQLYGAGQRNPPESENVDIRSVWIGHETTTTVEVGLQMGRWPMSTLDQGSSRAIAIEFRQSAVNYTLMHLVTEAGSSLSFCEGQKWILFVSSQFVSRQSECIASQVDASTGTVRIPIKKEYLIDERYAPLSAGSELRDLRAEARKYTGYLPTVQDRAPDAGLGPAFVSVKSVGVQEGDIFAGALRPIRTSNGEATTLLFEVALTNRGDLDHVIALSSIGVPADWTVRLPQSIRLSAASRVTVPVVLAMNFTHLHGVTQFFNVSAESATHEGHRASVQLGVHWLETPQPAGHHDVLYFHSAPRGFGYLPHELGGWTDFWMNTLEKDLNQSTTDQPVSGRTISANNFPHQSETEWYFPLRPPPQIGLHLDGTREGKFVTKIRTTAPLQGATVTAFLQHCDTTVGRSYFAWECPSQPGAVTIALTGTQTLSFAANAETTVDITLKVPEGVGLIPYKPSAKLLFILRIKAAPVPMHALLWEKPPNPHMVLTGSSLAVPLLEYHDPVDQAFERGGELQLKPLGPYEKLANPGGTSVFRFDVRNSGPETHRVRLELRGINENWVSIVGPTTFGVDSNTNHPVSAAVRVPDDAVSGERADVFLIAESENDALSSALTRFRVNVVGVDEKPVPDESDTLAGVVSGSSQTPGPLMAGVVFAVLAAFGLSRKKRWVH